MKEQRKIEIENKRLNLVKNDVSNALKSEISEANPGKMDRQPG